MTDTNKFGGPSNLVARLEAIDQVQARRYTRLHGVALDLATQSIAKHFRACDRMDVSPDASRIRECIDDAVKDNRFFICELPGR